MATIYRVSCASYGEETELEITDSLNPLTGSDNWRALDPSAWELEGGRAAWGGNVVHLHGFGAQPVAILHGFKKTTEVGDNGNGEKDHVEGSFPAGSFTWRCTRKN